MRLAVNSESRAAESTPPEVTAARTLAAGIRDRAQDIETARRLPGELVEAMVDAGLFRMCVPQALGGGEVHPATLVRAVEAIAYADGSAGWCVMIGATSGVVSAYLAPDVAREIYGTDSRVVTGGAYAPAGTATVIDGGYRVAGRWPFASGCEHCGWLMGGCMILRDGEQHRLPDGTPEMRMMLFPTAAARVIDTWTVSGLRGTGSHDIAVADLFVAADHSVSLITDRPRHTGALYVFPVFGLLAMGIAAVALGLARAAIDVLLELAGSKTPSLSHRRLSERAVIQMQVAQAEALLRSARAFLLATIDELWQSARSRRAVSIEQRAVLRLAATQATIASAQAVDLMYNAGGSTSIYAASPLQRCFRDVHVVTQHTMVAPATYELIGRVLLGLPADIAML